MTDRPPAARPGHRLLVVEDEPSIRTLLEATLRLTGYEVSSTDTGQSALLEVERLEPHLVLLDVMLPDLDGFEVTRRLRAAGNDCPILFLTARTGTDDRISGLSVGGDDYVAKPFNLEEVLLRIEAILRRTAPRHRAGGPEGPELCRPGTRQGRPRGAPGGEYIALSPTEFKLLAYLLANAGQVVTKVQILDHVWSYDFAGDVRIIETYVRYLRKKIDRFDPPLIQTVRGVGYSLRLSRDHGGTPEQ